MGSVTHIDSDGKHATAIYVCNGRISSCIAKKLQQQPDKQAHSLLRNGCANLLSAGVSNMIGPVRTANKIVLDMIPNIITYMVRNGVWSNMLKGLEH